MDIRRVVGKNVRSCPRKSWPPAWASSRTMSVVWKEAAKIPLSSPFGTRRRRWVFAQPCYFGRAPRDQSQLRSGRRLQRYFGKYELGEGEAIQFWFAGERLPWHLADPR